jgi:MYXO-CTERM domain-containing protein
MRPFIFFLFFLLGGIASASVTINFDFGPVYTAGGGGMVASGTIGVLVANTGGSGFAQGESLVGSTLSVGGDLGGNRILGVMNASDISTLGDFGFSSSVVVNDFTGITNGSSTGAGGTQLMFYWFPGLTTGGATVAEGQSYGFFRSDTIDTGSGSDISFNMPADGGIYSLAAYDTTLGGGYASSLFQANSVAGVPEPGRMVLALLGLAGLALRRRR